jgi:hypothetical protein
MKDAIMSDALKIIKVHEVNKTNLVRDFLLEMLLTGAWSNKFQNVLIEDDKDIGLIIFQTIYMS